MRKLLTFLTAILLISLTGCGSKGISNLTGPGSTLNLPQWSPYINAHTPGGVESAYRDATTALISNGMLRGVRIEIDKRAYGLNNPYTKMFNSMGIEVLGLIDNYYLFDDNIEQDISNIFSAYPEIRYFQIGNEITTILPSSGPRMSIEQYMTVLKKVYNFVRVNYPDRVLLTQSTFGSGIYGPNELSKMADLGLTSMSPNNLIIAVNVYSSATLVSYPGIINDRLGGYRVWVTETGTADPNEQISYVQHTYDEIRNYLRPERIYWYTLWGGDSGNDSGFSLIMNPYQYPNYAKSPLFKVLAGK